MVELSDPQEDRTQQCALQRQGGAEEGGNSNLYAAKVNNRSRKDDLTLHLRGARCEMAAAIAYSVEAPLHVNTYKTYPDIGEWGEVRGRSQEWWGRQRVELQIRKDDPKDRYYILAIGTHVRGTPVKVVGGIWGKDAMKDEWWKDPNGKGFAWWVPFEELFPVEKLPSGWV